MSPLLISCLALGVALVLAEMGRRFGEWFGGRRKHERNTERAQRRSFSRYDEEALAELESRQREAEGL